MMAELNLLEGMEESVRQLSHVERTRGISLAQQESVSLAQVLKVRNGKCSSRPNPHFIVILRSITSPEDAGQKNELN